MYHLVILFTAAALLSGGCRSANVNRHIKLLEMENNNIESNKVNGSASKRYLHFTRKPAARILHHAGQTLELTCDAVGSPAPSVHWFRNDAPLYSYDKESNEIIDTNPTSLGRVTSTLLVTRADPVAIYTCFVVSGSKTLRATTTVYSTDGKTDIPERSKLVPLAPRILVSYRAFVDIMGNTIVLPCRVKGHPKPAITWRDNNGIVIKTDPRRKVLRSGELVISPLEWGDVGEYTCHASNMFGSSEIKTFVYAARPDDESDG